MEGRDQEPRKNPVVPMPSSEPPEEGILDGVRYTADDFHSSTAPYEAVYRFHGDSFQEGMQIERMAKFARSLKVTSFKKLYKDYAASLRTAAGTPASNVAQFDQQNMELNIGEWMADDSGIWKYGAYGTTEIACPHPIMPVERLKNIDTGELKVRIQFRRGDRSRRPWEERIIDFDTLSNSKNIVSLSKFGISVTSGKRSQNLVDYLTDVMDLNYDAIPERRSVSRMGWNEEGFSPYVKDIIFDGNPGFARMFDAITMKGDVLKWLDTARQVRRESVIARIVLAASFASVLIKPLGTLPFFVHLWGVDSGTGKSVAQMVGASVWGDPNIGGPFFPTFRSTSVGLEITAGFLHNIPVFIDELQLARDHRGKQMFNVYELAAGAGKQRSNRNLGLNATPTWANCFITSGESTIVGDNDGAGAANRVLEIECRADEKVIGDGRAVAACVKANYGWGGKMFVDCLQKDGAMDMVRQAYEAFLGDCISRNATEKQALSAALLVTADFFATEWIFKDGMCLCVDDMEVFMKTREQVSAGARGYEYLCGWVAQNAGKFTRDGKSSEPLSDNYGVISRDGSSAWIIRTVFNAACEGASFSPRAILSYLRSQKLIDSISVKYTKTKRISGIPTECVVMLLPKEDFSSSTDV